MDSRLLPQIESIFSRLKTPIVLLDSAGNSLIPKESIRFTLPKLDRPGTPVEKEGRLYQLSAYQSDLVLMSPLGESDQVRDAFLLCDTLIASVMAVYSGSNDVNYAYQRILQNDMSLAEIDAVVDESRIPANVKRCVLLLHMVQVQQSSAYEILNEITPRIQNDVLVVMDKHTVALVKDVTGVEDADELRQFALALQETLLSETALNVTVGIGDMAEHVSDLHASYRQARRAIEIGRLYSPERSIHVYRSMLLERFLSDLSPEMAEHYHGLLFNRSTARLFSEEMLYTIEMFFRKDLNLSDTARQLYIHRNTLVYRLDKVQRQLGLDLRKFDDAVTFKMLLEMRRCGNNKAKAKKGRL